MANVPEIDKFTVLQYDEIVMIVEKIYMTTVNFYENQSTLIMYSCIHTLCTFVMEMLKEKNVDGKKMKFKKMNELI